ncbi:MAG: methyltransferase domain-containing protein [Actinobacteria bacterium]|jgi:23S rRNA (guanine745-N1)-methyltransferase|nr:methyltransferase domain-containing protein [Actinomycetota bacterium]
MGTDIGDFTVFACPHCTMPLRLSQQEARCENNHLFDRSRDGYINLVVGGRLAATTTSGDTAESLRSRRDFFATGSYAPIASALAHVLREVSGPILDVGCGEGYYFTHINATEKYGIDISKKAVQMASKLLPDAHFAVASAFRLPIVDHSCAAVFTVFAPHSFEEYARILKPGGTWVTVTPGPHHLQQMRPKRDQSIDDREERRSEPPIQAQQAERIQFELDLSLSAATDLFSMTPLVWQTAADASPATQVSVDVWVSSGTSL